jgi:hypothetical protein
MYCTDWWILYEWAFDWLDFPWSSCSLHVTDSEIQTMPWATVLEKVVLVQSSRQLCVVKDLNAHDIVMRLMRKENYLIGMLNKGVLAFPISKWIPGAGPTVKSSTNGTQYRLVLTKTLEWTLNWCILQSMFDRYVHYCKITNSFSIIIFSIIRSYN